MKRIFTLCYIILVSVPALFAQQLAFFNGDTQLENNAEITVRNTTLTPVPEELEVPAGLRVKNLTGQEISAKMRQTIIAYTGSGEELINFCFFNCSNIPLNQTVTEFSSKIAANSFEENFHANLIVYPGEYATADVRYDLTPQGSLQSYSVIVHFIYDENSQMGLNKLSSGNEINISRNGNSVIFDYTCKQADANMEIYSLIGNKVAHYPLSLGSNRLVLREKLPQGVYVCVLKEGKNNLKTQKFIVR